MGEELVVEIKEDRSEWSIDNFKRGTLSLSKRAGSRKSRLVSNILGCFRHRRPRGFFGTSCFYPSPKSGSKREPPQKKVLSERRFFLTAEILYLADFTSKLRLKEIWLFDRRGALRDKWVTGSNLLRERLEEMKETSQLHFLLVLARLPLRQIQLFKLAYKTAPVSQDAIKAPPINDEGGGNGNDGGRWIHFATNQLAFFFKEGVQNLGAFLFKMFIEKLI